MSKMICLYQNNYQGECGFNPSAKAAFRKERCPESYTGEIHQPARGQKHCLSNISFLMSQELLFSAY